MAHEIERKFLVDVDAWKPAGPGTLFRQGYLSSHKARVVRVRVEGSEAKLTIKGATEGITRVELEYPIPLADAELMLRTLCEQPLVEKTRHKEMHGGKLWEIDVFHGDNEGLVMAELELAAEDQEYETPSWVVREVSSDSRYYNSNLISAPYKTWR
ncbi:MAG: CYTH domain-containing protein [Deltaproteobacteria bacterium]|nr:CYTH domain-containing protein [Deltaproteobacteria bacterium]